jgi:signal transduction histidine kinase
VRSLAAAFNETVAKLSRLLHSQGDFVADASHELRTPLTALQLRLESLPQSQDRDAALLEVDRLRDVVDGLLALARADAGSEASARVDASALMRQRVDAWSPLADEHGVTLVADLDGPLPAHAAPGRLAQVLDNLLANALDATPRGGKVTFSALATPSWVELHLRDEGPGMTREQRERAFDRFWRAGSGEGGSGLGLAIVKRLVTADEGEVELGEAPGGGVDAVVRLRPA